VNILSFNGVKPSARGLGDGVYPFFKSIYLVTMPKTPKAARQFIEFICSKEGRKIMQKYENLVVEARYGHRQ
jgi:phosphate transport system substrate-binding protein